MPLATYDNAHYALQNSATQLYLGISDSGALIPSKDVSQWQHNQCAGQASSYSFIRDWRSGLCLYLVDNSTGLLGIHVCSEQDLVWDFTPYGGPTTPEEIVIRNQNDSFSNAMYDWPADPASNTIQMYAIPSSPQTGAQNITSNYLWTWLSIPDSQQQWTINATDYVDAIRGYATPSTTSSTPLPIITPYTTQTIEYTCSTSQIQGAFGTAKSRPFPNSAAELHGSVKTNMLLTGLAIAACLMSMA